MDCTVWERKTDREKKLIDTINDKMDIKKKKEKEKYYLKDTIENWRFINKLLQTNKKRNRMT